MKYTIKKGRHRASPLRFRLFLKPKHLHFVARLNDTCEYDLFDVDQLDANKLLGLGFVNFKKFPMHHYESIRVGWRYSLVKDCFELFAYTYIKGKRTIEYICSAQSDSSMSIDFYVSDIEYKIMISFFDGKERQTSEVKIARGIKSNIAYFLGPYFGGNEKAPRDMQITIL